MAKIKAHERRALENFRDLEVSLEELRPLIAARISFNFRPKGPYTRGVQKHTDPAEPAVPINVSHLHKAYLKWRERDFADNDLADWASMLLMNDDYEYSEGESEIIAEWLNRAAMKEVGPVVKA